MKKWIPKNTSYCGDCRWRKYIKTIYYNKDKNNCPHSSNCKNSNICWTTLQTSCKIIVFRCEYLNYTDWNEESLLWDGCKECGIQEGYKS
jgi:hypothetical protein